MTSARLPSSSRLTQIKVKADEMEARENEQAAAAHMMRIRIEEERILKRQAAEMEARFSTQATGIPKGGANAPLCGPCSSGFPRATAQPSPRLRSWAAGPRPSVDASPLPRLPPSPSGSAQADRGLAARGGPRAPGRPRDVPAAMRDGKGALLFCVRDPAVASGGMREEPGGPLRERRRLT